MGSVSAVSARAFSGRAFFGKGFGGRPRLGGGWLGRCLGEDGRGREGHEQRGCQGAGPVRHHRSSRTGSRVRSGRCPRARAPTLRSIAEVLRPRLIAAARQDQHEEARIGGEPAGHDETQVPERGRTGLTTRRTCFASWTLSVPSAASRVATRPSIRFQIEGVVRQRAEGLARLARIRAVTVRIAQASPRPASPDRR